MTDDPWLEQFAAAHAEREQTNRTFNLLGEQLTIKASIAPEVSIRLNNVRRLAQADLEAARAAAEADPDGPPPAESITDEGMLQVADATVLACLDPASHDSWRRLRDPDHPNPLTFREIFRLCDYLIGRASGHPTDAPSGSSTGQTETELSSTADSSSTEPAPTV